jgi:signal transduction histidine kinase
VLELQLDASLSEEQKQEFYLALSSAQSVKNMISDLLDISKMEEGKFKLRQEEIRLDAVFKEVEESMKILATQDGKSIIMNAHVGLPAFFGDKEIIKRIISNLIGNALKFTPKGTAIEVNAKFTEDERVIVVSVKDHGQGIPQEYLHRIFEKFVQVESAQVKSRAGKGLGLTFCKMAVEAHQGKIWVESEEGKGSTFYFTLPVI